MLKVGRKGYNYLSRAAAFVLGCYAAYVGTTWLRYGKHRRRDLGETLLDRYMPDYEIGERHAVRVAAPAGTTLSAAMECDLEDSTVVRSIFKGRELLLRSKTEARPAPRGLVAQMKAIGWGVLDENPGREIVLGAVTKPWESDVVFRTIPPDQFASFQEPGFAKIAWTLRADPVSDQHSIARTETRVATTDPASRARFRRYWSFLSPGILVIRRAMLRMIKREAERRNGTDHRTA